MANLSPEEAVTGPLAQAVGTLSGHIAHLLVRVAALEAKTGLVMTPDVEAKIRQLAGPIARQISAEVVASISEWAKEQKAK